MVKAKVLPPFVSVYRGGLGAGVDEAGRGPLAGDVVAAAVILNPLDPIEGIDDSKRLSEKRRNILFDEICQRALAVCIASASVAEIDELNILHASMLAMQRAVDGLDPTPEHVWVDGNRLPKWHYPSEAVVQGDARVTAVGAASVLAKVTRDRQLIEMDQRWPEYGFAQHKGYPTKLHLERLAELGPCPTHRRSFGPVKRILNGLI